MSHHSSTPDPKMSERLIKQFAESGQKVQEEINKILAEHLGPTGQFPHGKLTEQDEGEIAFAIFVKDRKVVVDFNHPVHWLGMTRNQAIELGRLLIKRAKEIN